MSDAARAALSPLEKFREQRLARQGPVSDYRSPDGIERNIEEEFRINELHKLVLRGTAAEDFIAYYQNLTLRRVLGWNLSANALIHLEGQRFIVGLMDTRLQLGINGLPHKLEERK